MEVLSVVLEPALNDDDRDGDKVEIGIAVDEEKSSCCACAMMYLLVDDVEVEVTNWAH